MILARRLMGASAPSGGGSVPTFVARAWGDTGGSPAGSFQIAKPSGTVQGDLMIAEVAGANNTFTADVGWTRRVNGGNNFNLSVFEKVAGASEPSSYTFTGGAPREMGGEIQTWRGAKIDQVGSVYQGSSTSPIVMRGVTPSDTAILLAIVATQASGGTYSTPSGMTSRAVTNTNEPSMATFYQSVPKQIATGTRSSTPVASGNQRGVMLALVGA